MPAFFVINLYVTTFYFISGLVLFEKSEGIPTMLATTPLRDVEYLLSKVVSLTLLALVESLLIVLAVLGAGGEWVPLLSGAFLLGALFRAGWIYRGCSVRLDQFILDSVVLYVTALLLPLLPHFGLADRTIFYLHPAEPALALMRAAYMPKGVWEMVYAVAAALGWVGIGFIVARRRFYRFVVCEAGHSGSIDPWEMPAVYRSLGWIDFKNVNATGCWPGWWPCR